MEARVKRRSLLLLLGLVLLILLGWQFLSAVLQSRVFTR